MALIWGSHRGDEPALGEARAGSEARAGGLQEGPGVRATSRAEGAEEVWSQKAWGSVERSLGFIVIAVGVHVCVCSQGM